MTDPTLPANMREFHCYHCRGKIRIPKDLPPTTGPCPHCQKSITSPVPEGTYPAAPLPPAPTAPPQQQQPPARTVAPLPTQGQPYQPPQQPAAPPYQAPQQAAAPPYQPPQQPAAPPYQAPQQPAAPPYQAPQQPAAPQQAAAPPYQAPQQPAAPPYQPPQQPAAPQQAAAPPYQIPQQPAAPAYQAPQQPAPPPQQEYALPVQTAPAEQAAAQPVEEPAPAPAASTLPARGSADKKREKQEAKALEEQKKSSSSAAPAIFLGCLLLAIAGGAGFLVYKELNKRTEVQPPSPTGARPGAAVPGGSSRPPGPSLSESQYMRIGWQKDAYSVLGGFLAAKTAAEKIPYIINGESLRPQVEAFYGGSVINDQDTPVDAFSVMELSEEDRKRGIFMLVFDQPPQFEMKEFFRPLATLELQYGLDEADILFSTMARVENFATQPVRATALFKKTPEGLKLDWETFSQTKYRTFGTLIELPEAGQGGVFRVIISEDVPESGRTLPAGIKTYRIWDPSAPETSARVNVNIDSEIGRSLSKIDWRGKENRPTNSTATIELKWVGADQPKLEITRFICWEFLHLGGTETPAAPR